MYNEGTYADPNNPNYYPESARKSDYEYRKFLEKENEKLWGIVRSYQALYGELKREDIKKSVKIINEAYQSRHTS